MADKEKRFVMELADLQNDRRAVTFMYGGQEIPIAYNPGAFTRQSADDEAEEDGRRRLEVMAEALEDRKVERFLGIDDGAAFVDDPDGLAAFLDGEIKRAGRRRDFVIEALASGLLTEWPVAQDGVALPIDNKQLSSLPYLFVAECYGAIMEDMTPGKNSSRGRDRRGRRSR